MVERILPPVPDDAGVAEQAVDVVARRSRRRWADRSRRTRARKFSRLRRIVSHDRPDWKPSRHSFSNSRRSSRRPGSPTRCRGRRRSRRSTCPTSTAAGRPRPIEMPSLTGAAWPMRAAGGAAIGRFRHPGTHGRSSFRHAELREEIGDHLDALVARVRVIGREVLRRIVRAVGAAEDAQIVHARSAVARRGRAGRRRLGRCHLGVEFATEPLARRLRPADERVVRRHHADRGRLGRAELLDLREDRLVVGGEVGRVRRQALLRRLLRRARAVRVDAERVAVVATDRQHDDVGIRHERLIARVRLQPLQHALRRVRLVTEIGELHGVAGRRSERPDEGVHEGLSVAVLRRHVGVADAGYLPRVRG